MSAAILAFVFALLVVGLVANALVKDRKEYRRFARLKSSRNRRRMLRKWLKQSFVIFGGSAIVTLALAWQFVPLVLAEIDAIGWVAAARDSFASSGLGQGIAIGIIVALVGGAVLGIVAARNETDIPSVGDVQALLPRNRAELKYGAALSINAGVVEELLFRLAMPAVIYGFTGNAIVAVGISVLVFGALHAYQGLPGIIGATIIGAVLMAIYLATNSILVAIVVHALFDLRSLVLIPIIVNRAHRIPAKN